ncbi:MAG: bifunctional diaminohydroxyphosphoribosylaminopyrimidine deaminase/5-amino-6-(5-phosphoribosylamino)uracil reductase RibD [Candidatus Omnitrophica bacterium]|nr:bifunctional diaminohydroxyphosphoribosylaminopyrimidine deaminase/5-amino-6-(5-phosphoribosylamino)uracil reductase RibD [Candidatus Omnitrophota bacterium]MCF7876924.1 bifunctional diaminohydroxyphosphoribosylaminopyrimidine deaminase/5-amino-6-(5-phosphoribosylamino)uracil reductase RibD [Candidatus Omnitrophota bacterium]MCF7878604.1 bifunctional diaminohydroxyphosphoribosylaminopyrimidine deaminase/5-amino-6-(5-phosphoribosylamino)uracil reductase RibD [Candidatus Omnitrophota bacterium]
MKERDIYFMEKAIRLAKKGVGSVSPNPLVGAVVVKNNKIISEGFHKKPGLAHAEAEALEKAGIYAQKAVLYVNLEPCCHFGRMPPCLDKIIKAGIKRVVIATKDPNPKVYGRSIKKLRDHNIEVTNGVCRDKAEKLNEVFFKNMKEKLPFVVAKAAQTLDGKIATSLGRSKWITTDKSRNFSRKLRDKYDAVLIGAETLRKDNPKLNGLKKKPYKIIISSSLDLPKNSYIFKNSADKIIIFTLSKLKTKSNLPKPVKIFALKEAKKGISLKQVLRKLYSYGIMSVFVEGGSYTLGRFFEEKIVDKVYFFIAPKICGGENSITSVGAAGVKKIEKCLKLQKVKIKKIDEDILIRGYLK